MRRFWPNVVHGAVLGAVSFFAIILLGIEPTWRISVLILIILVVDNVIDAWLDRRS